MKKGLEKRVMGNQAIRPSLYVYLLASYCKDIRLPVYGW